MHMLQLYISLGPIFFILCCDSAVLMAWFGKYHVLVLKHQVLSAQTRLEMLSWLLKKHPFLIQRTWLEKNPTSQAVWSLPPEVKVSSCTCNANMI